MSQPDDLATQVARYRDVVQQYEALDETIDALIMDYGGMSENMPPDALDVYRALAAQRDDLYNEMLSLGQMLNLDDDR